MQARIKRVVMAGCGGMSGAWLEPCREFADVEIVGLVDLKLENAEKAKDKHGLSSALTGVDLADMLARTKPDALFDCTVPEAHLQVTMTALEHNCHVLGEKPMADTMPHARLMKAKAAEKKRIYAVIQNQRYMDNIVACRDFLRTGRIGELNTVNADFYLGPHFGGFREAMDHVLLLDMAIHTFDQARFLTGRDAVSVYCHEWNPANSWYRHGASAVCIFTMTGGLIFTYRGSWCAEGLPTSWQSQWRLVGGQGTCLWDAADGVKAQIVAKREGFTSEFTTVDVPVPPALKLKGHAALLREFLDCIDQGGVPQTVCTDNIKSLAMVHAALESAGSGRKVDIAQE